MPPRREEHLRLDTHARGRLEEIILAGELDAAVEQRAHTLGWRPPAPKPTAPPNLRGFQRMRPLREGRDLGRGRA